ncbi:MAG: hypothetical protein HYZ00_12680 [Candidatus Hydrogenedentes bacterium]|nr:hypothetical protein [Candidatus Hydrogenedentota bacterium]
MQCPEAKQQLEEHFDAGETLPGPLLAHLAACPRCMAYQRRLEALTQTFTQGPDVPPQLVQSVIRAVVEHSPSTRRPFALDLNPGWPAGRTPQSRPGAAGNILAAAVALVLAAIAGGYWLPFPNIDYAQWARPLWNAAVDADLPGYLMVFFEKGAVWEAVLEAVLEDAAAVYSAVQNAALPLPVSPVTLTAAITAAALALLFFNLWETYSLTKKHLRG